MGMLSHAEEATPPCRSLGEYVRLLLREVERHDPLARARIAAVVERRRAWITLDAETVEVSLRNGRLSVRKPVSRAPSGEGRTSRVCTLDLLDAHIEVTEAVLSGALELTGSLDDVTRMSMAIEVLIDASARIPAMRRLADDFRNDPCREAPEMPLHLFGHRVRLGLTASSAAELSLLERLGLLP